MNIEISTERLERLDISNIKIDDTIIFCHNCNYQDKNIARRPECPECGNHLYLLDITDEVFSEIEDIVKNSGK